MLMEGAYHTIYGENEREDISKLVDIYAPLQERQSIAENPSILHDAEVIFTGWGGPLLNETFLSNAPNLKAVFYGAGSIKRCVTDAFWGRDILITSAFAANAIPVAEYTLSQILFCLKRGWHYANKTKNDGTYIMGMNMLDYVPGAYRSTVGIISLGMIGRKVCELLKPFDVQVIAYDPFVSGEVARKLNVKLCTLEEVFENADVVSLHTPLLKETENMISGEHFKAMKPSSSFINTSRGAVVKESEMIEVLKERTDIQAVLDVTHPEPPVEGSPLYTLPNVVLTPHIAGSMGGECNRMGRYMVEELERYIKGEPLRWAISKEKATTLA